jgi:hypothetical protein
MILIEILIEFSIKSAFNQLFKSYKNKKKTLLKAQILL